MSFASESNADTCAYAESGASAASEKARRTTTTHPPRVTAALNICTYYIYGSMRSEQPRACFIPWATRPSGTADLEHEATSTASSSFARTSAPLAALAPAAPIERAPTAMRDGTSRR